MNTIPLNTLIEVQRALAQLRDADGLDLKHRLVAAEALGSLNFYVTEISQKLMVEVTQ